jgi:hypothetical protein
VTSPRMKAGEQFLEITEYAKVDIFHILDNLKQGSSMDQFWRRTLVRTFFAQVDAEISAMKQMAIIVAETPNTDPAETVVFTRAEIELLNEREYRIQNGVAEETKAKISLRTNLQFAFEMFRKASRSAFSLQTNGHQWECFLKAIKIRDRLTHPKTVQDLIVTDAEMSVITKAFTWHITQTSKSFIAATAAMNAVSSNNATSSQNADADITET